VNLSKIVTSSSRPLYEQIKTSLKSAINQHEILPGEKIPSLENLCKMYGVSRMTARQAVQELVRDGVLYTVIGKGTFVAIKTKKEPPLNSVWGFSDSFSSIEGNHFSRLLSLKIQPAGERIGKKLNVHPESSIYRLSRLRLLDHQPVAVEHSHLPVDRFPNLESFDWNHASLYNVLRENYKIDLSHGKQFVDAGCASGDIAQLLEVKPNFPLLIMERMITSHDGWNVEYGYAYYRSDSIRLLIRLSKSESFTLVKSESY